MLLSAWSITFEVVVLIDGVSVATWLLDRNGEWRPGSSWASVCIRSTLHAPGRWCRDVSATVVEPSAASLIGWSSSRALVLGGCLHPAVHCEPPDVSPGGPAPIGERALHRRRGLSAFRGTNHMHRSRFLVIWALDRGLGLLATAAGADSHVPCGSTLCSPLKRQL